MYRILIADDEGIMLQSLQEIITKEFGNSVEIATAKNGRSAIEQAESFHPDIVFMDIQMPGINGIQAIREIRTFNSSALFYVISAYDKFDYAQDAIALGVEKYLMKPISRSTVIDTIGAAIRKVDGIREKRSDQLKIQEKLQTIIPVVETGFVSNMLLSERIPEDDEYRQLLEITQRFAFVAALEFGADDGNGKPASTVKSRLQAQEAYTQIREIIKDAAPCIVGPVMSNRIIVVFPTDLDHLDYEQRIQAIETARGVLTTLEEKTGLKYRAGIGRTCPFADMRTSYQEASMALQNSLARVSHVDDLGKNGLYEDDYPIDVEKEMIARLEKGDVDGMRSCGTRFFGWMVRKDPDDLNSMRLKCLELVMRAETAAFNNGSVNYAYSYRKDYLTQIGALTDASRIQEWFLDKMTDAASDIRDSSEQQSESIVERARKYIQSNYTMDISLDDVSREVNVSPYYFSKLFKEEVGENFIDYLTGLRIGHAKEALKDLSLSVKEIAVMSGYADPNYFSRIFKKQTGMTPREYRESTASGRRTDGAER